MVVKIFTVVEFACPYCEFVTLPDDREFTYRLAIEHYKGMHRRSRAHLASRMRARTLVRPVRPSRDLDAWVAA